eukprot:908398-Pelagomonas_calceolata.AAC.9
MIWPRSQQWGSCCRLCFATPCFQVPSCTVPPCHHAKLKLPSAIVHRASVPPCQAKASKCHHPPDAHAKTGKIAASSWIVCMSFIFAPWEASVSSNKCIVQKRMNHNLLHAPPPDHALGASAAGVLCSLSASSTCMCAACMQLEEAQLQEARCISPRICMEAAEADQRRYQQLQESKQQQQQQQQNEAPNDSVAQQERTSSASGQQAAQLLGTSADRNQGTVQGSTPGLGSERVTLQEGVFLQHKHQIIVLAAAWPWQCASRADQ